MSSRSVLRWVILGQLARSHRPGYYQQENTSVTVDVVDDYIISVKHEGISSIICLLNYDQLPFYCYLPDGLIEYYRRRGLEVAHIPVFDHQTPALEESHLKMIWEYFKKLPKPVLVHCSAGQIRTGMAIQYIQDRLDEV